MGETVKELAKRYAPDSVKKRVRVLRVKALRRRIQGRSLEDVFEEIYRKRLWGSALYQDQPNGHSFHSGSGSRGLAAKYYVSLVRDFITDHGIRSAVDIGCGDFSVASGFTDSLESYVGVDVVGSVIAENERRYARDGLSFLQANACSDQLPTGDLCLIRQVFQHLSNSEILQILERIDGRYRYVLITEHLPAKRLRTSPNSDKPHGPDTRLDSGSWVDLQAPPFTRSPVESIGSVQLEEPQFAPGEFLLTTLWTPEHR